VINRSVARRYARALLELVESDPTSMAEKLSAFAGLVESNRNLAQLLVNPAFSIEERGRVLTRILQGLGWGPPLSRFLELLVQRRRIGHLGAIAEEFMGMADEQAGRVRVEVESAVDQGAAPVAKLTKALAEGLKKEVIVERKVDPDLIAGMAVRVGSLVVDGTLRSQIARMKETLARGS